MLKLLRYLAVSIIPASLIACSDDGSLSMTNTPAEPKFAAKLYDTSYENFKLNGLDIPLARNYGFRWGGNPTAVTYGDFLKEGELSIAQAHENYTWGIGGTAYADILNDPSDYASEVRIYKVNEDKSLVAEVTIKGGCLMPRKLLAADFNKDNIPDIFMACHGYDNHPYPGEKNMLIMSVSRGQYTISEVGEVGFHHGASAADVNNDGYPDVVTLHDNIVIFYINQKDGTFIKDTTRFSYKLPQYTAYFNLELIDLDKDGLLDIIAGGDEFNGAVTTIFYGSPDGTFGTRMKSLPAVEKWGIVQDFTLIGSKLILDRTPDPEHVMGSYYGYMVQMIDLITNQSEILGSVTPAPPRMWFLPKTRNGVIGVGPFDTTDFYPLP